MNSWASSKFSAWIGLAFRNYDFDIFADMLWLVPKFMPRTKFFNEKITNKKYWIILEAWKYHLILVNLHAVRVWNFGKIPFRQRKSWNSKLFNLSNHQRTSVQSSWSTCIWNDVFFSLDKKRLSLNKNTFLTFIFKNNFRIILYEFW